MNLCAVGGRAIGRTASIHRQIRSRMKSSSRNAQTERAGSVYFTDLPPLVPVPSLERVMSPSVVKSRIAERVAQRNTWPEYQYFPGNMQFLRYLCRNFRDIVTDFKIPSDLDQTFPLQEVDWNVLREPTCSLQVTWIGHASLLVQMNGHNILTDPVFSARCAPTQFAGPKRYRPPAFEVDDLKKQQISIDFVLITHNHYDHLDYQSVADLARSFPRATFVVPLGLESWLKRSIGRDLKIVQLDWDECFSPSPSIHITAVPMCHWSNRYGWDRDKSLWCGFIIKGEKQTFLFPGDTGWFDGLYEIGKRYGRINMAALPIGAYQPAELMRASHTNPEEAVEMMNAIQAKQAVPIHWGTFPLTLEPVMEPRERLLSAVEAANLDASSFSPWLIGETVACRDR